MAAEDVAERAELAVVLLRHAVCSGAAEVVAVDGDLGDLDVEATVALVNALLDAERERRARQWAALERLLPMIPPGGGILEEVVHLPRKRAAQAAGLALDCGWFWPGPDRRIDGP